MIEANSGSTLCISSLPKFNNGMASHFLIRSQLEYEGGQAYADSGHVFILAYTQRNVWVTIGHTHSLDMTIYKCCTLWVWLHRHLHCTNSSINQVCSPARSHYVARNMSLLETSSLGSWTQSQYEHVHAEPTYAWFLPYQSVSNGRCSPCSIRKSWTCRG